MFSFYPSDWVIRTLLISIIVCPSCNQPQYTNKDQYISNHPKMQRPLLFIQKRQTQTTQKVNDQVIWNRNTAVLLVMPTWASLPVQHVPLLFIDLWCNTVCEKTNIYIYIYIYIYMYVCMYVYATVWAYKRHCDEQVCRVKTDDSIRDTAALSVATAHGLLAGQPS
jgi:uncharacterized protein YbaR (Trm112 family)